MAVTGWASELAEEGKNGLGYRGDTERITPLLS